RRGITERRRVMLGQMIAVEPGAIVGFDEFEPLFEEPIQGHSAVVQVIKDPKAHNVLLFGCRGGVVSTRSYFGAEVAELKPAALGLPEGPACPELPLDRGFNAVREIPYARDFELQIFPPFHVYSWLWWINDNLLKLTDKLKEVRFRSGLLSSFIDCI